MKVPGTEIRLQRHLEPACSSDDEWCAPPALPHTHSRHGARIRVVTHRPPPRSEHTEGEAGEAFAKRPAGRCRSSALRYEGPPPRSYVPWCVQKRLEHAVCEDCFREMLRSAPINPRDVMNGFCGLCLTQVRAVTESWCKGDARAYFHFMGLCPQFKARRPARPPCSAARACV